MIPATGVMKNIKHTALLIISLLSASVGFASSPAPRVLLDPYERHMVEVLIPAADSLAAYFGVFERLNPGDVSAGHARMRAAVLREALDAYRKIRDQQPVQQFSVVEDGATTYVVTITVPKEPAQPVKKQ